jgi:hypothetical protein
MTEPLAELARILAQALAANLREYPDGPPAEPSATSGTRTSRSRPKPIISGTLHPPREP